MAVLTRPTNRDVALPMVAARAASAKKASDPVILDVGPVLAICDYFVIASGSNDRQVRAICDEIESEVRQAGGGSPIRVEGLADGRWVLLDYGDFVAHIFLDEAREYYDLERLWADAARVPFEAPAAVVGE